MARPAAGGETAGRAPPRAPSVTESDDRTPDPGVAEVPRTGDGSDGRLERRDRNPGRSGLRGAGRNNPQQGGRAGGRSGEAYERHPYRAGGGLRVRVIVHGRTVAVWRACHAGVRPVRATGPPPHRASSHQADTIGPRPRYGWLPPDACVASHLAVTARSPADLVPAGLRHARLLLGRVLRLRPPGPPRVPRRNVLHRARRHPEFLRDLPH